MQKIFIGLMATILAIGASIAVIGAAIGLFTNNFDMIGGAVAMILLVLLLGIALGMVLDVIENFI